MTYQLTQDEYKSTIPTKMVDVTDSVEAVVDIWEYIQQLKADKIVLDYVYDNQLVEKVYRNQENTFEHILLPNVSGARRKFQKYEKATQASINVSDLASGTYLIEIMNGTNAQTQKIIIQR